MYVLKRNKLLYLYNIELEDNIMYTVYSHIGANNILYYINDNPVLTYK